MGRARRPIQIVILMLIVILGGYAVGTAVFGGGENIRLKVGDSPPDFNLRGLDGQVHNLEKYQGKSLVINFWATWCKYCVSEMPALQTQWEKWQDQDVVILGINTGEDDMTVSNFVKQTGVDFPILFDKNNEIVGKYGVVPMPTTFFVNKKGKITSIVQGELELKTLNQQIDQLVRSR